MSAARTLLILLLLIVSARLAEVPRQYVSSQPGGWWDEQPAATLPSEATAPSEGVAGLRRLEEDVLPGAKAIDEAPETPVAFEAERVENVPVRALAALPSEATAPHTVETRRLTPPPAVEPIAAVDIVHAEPEPEAFVPPAPKPRTGRVSTRAETVYYEIEGLSRTAISSALRTHGPTVRGQQFFGLTEWEMGVEYQPVEVVSGCAIDDLTVHVSVETHLPRWPSDAVASAALREAWDRFITALDEHERGHRVYAEEAAETVRLRLLDVEAATCDRLDSVARTAMTTVMQEYEALQMAYDVDTGHGRTQGAVWPPPAAHASVSQGR